MSLNETTITKLGTNKKIAPSGLRMRLFMTSGLLLFLELALIRFIPSQITYFGYYANYILLASFVGIGVGTLLASRRFSFQTIFPCLLLAVVLVCMFFSFTVAPGVNGEIRFTSSTEGYILPDYLLVPAIFLIVALTFASVGQYLGRLLDLGKPLVVYTWDILGSLAGIAIFTLFSYLQTPPWMWFIVVVCLATAMPWPARRIFRVFAVIFFIMVVALSVQAGKSQRWSPYQKVTTTPVYENSVPRTLSGYRLSVNNIGHQEIIRDFSSLHWFYAYPYRAPSNATFNRALIIGAGTGNDVAVALAHGVKHVDAVEIDPVLFDIGKKIHPNKPYDDPRVTVYVDDGRAFLQKTKSTYDLIIYALPDSLVLAASHGNLRLESYLFTLESFAAAKKHLAPDGLFALYNFYRQPWLVEKITGMVDSTFGKPSYLFYGRDNIDGIVMNGGRIDSLVPEAEPSRTVQNPPPPATDTWPFLYLRNPSVPLYYIEMLAIIALIISGLVFSALRGTAQRKLEPTYFFLGAAFLLLETKSITQFALLFGSTWMVNALVFFAILLLVLAAIRLVDRLRIGSLTPWYIALGLSLVIQFLVPLSIVLPLSPALRYVLGALLTLFPVFLGNVIFARTFRDSTHNATNFAFNLLGAAAGGILEYSAMLIGYQYLVLVVMAMYALAFIMPYVGRRQKVLTSA